MVAEDDDDVRFDGRWRRWREDADAVFPDHTTEPVVLNLPRGVVRELERLARRESISPSVAAAYAIGFASVARLRSRQASLRTRLGGLRRRRGRPENGFS